MTQEKSANYGGVRANSGRPRMTDEAKLVREMERRQIVVDELLFPALVTAYRCEPDHLGERYLEVIVSKLDIELAYGKEGLAEWMNYFKIEKLGGRFSDGTGCATRWSVHLGKYMLIKKFIESCGADMKDLPEVWFPPEAMHARVNAAKEKQFQRKLKKMEKIWDETEQQMKEEA